MAHVLLAQGDARHMPLNDKSVHMICTSPPYWGLRDYQTGQWRGGDPTCDHSPATSPQKRGLASSTLTGGKATTGHQREGYHITCSHCGAQRKDDQLGLESLHDCNGAFTGESCGGCYVCHLRQVAAECWRVLRDDGVMFLNIGDSYFSGGRHAQGYDSDDRATQDYQGHGCASESLCDVRKGAVWNCIECTDARHVLVQAHELLRQIQVSMARLTGHLPIGDSFPPLQLGRSLIAIQDQAQTAILVVGQLRGVLASTNVGSLPRLQAFPTPSDAVLACLSSLHAFADCVQRCVDMLGESLEKQHCKWGTASPFAELEHCIRCTDGYCSLVSSWLNTPYIQPYYTTKKLKPKDLCGIPWRVALALQADGWYLRSDCIWSKPNPMPESVTDRPTRSHEYVFLFSKSPRYFYDAQAIAESSVANENRGGCHKVQMLVPAPGAKNDGFGERFQPTLTRNIRSVWTITTEPTPEAHFATMPSALVKCCILAGTSAYGVCSIPSCGAPWVRVVERQRLLDGHIPVTGSFSRPDEPFRIPPNGKGHYRYSSKVLEHGWEPSCHCFYGPGYAAPVPATVLDPFAGSGTTGVTAWGLGRSAVLCDLSFPYLRSIAKERLGFAALTCNNRTETPMPPNEAWEQLSFA